MRTSLMSAMRYATYDHSESAIVVIPEETDWTYITLVIGNLFVNIVISKYFVNYDYSVCLLQKFHT